MMFRLVMFRVMTLRAVMCRVTTAARWPRSAAVVRVSMMECAG